MKNITYLDNDTLPECVYKNKQNILAIIDEIAKTYGLDFKGEYSATETYTKNNVVVYNNKTYVYISIAPTSNILPTNTQFWALWIDPKQGAQGEKGEPGEKGADGGEVQSVVKVSTVENVDTYRMTFSNGYTADFTVTNGKDGQNGQNGQNGKGIESISLVSSTESSSTYRINYGDGLTFDFTVQNGVSPTIQIGSVNTVPFEQGASVVNSGTEKNLILDFNIPQGEKGENGVATNAEVVSEQTADDTQKVYSVAFTNGILTNFTGQINSIYSDLAKKLELSESSETISGTNPDGSTTVLNYVLPEVGTYAFYIKKYKLIGIFSTYGVLNGDVFSHCSATATGSTISFIQTNGVYDFSTSKLIVTQKLISADLSSSTVSTTARDLSPSHCKLIKLN